MQTPARRWRLSLGSLLIGLLLGLVLTAGAAALTLPTFLRHRGDWPIEHAVAELTKDLAIPADAAALQAPRALNDRRTLNQGRQAYSGACASCHGATGDGRGLFGAALYPDASHLRSSDTQEKTDGQLFWIIKNGLSFGGMPAFGETYPENTIWSLVGYVRALAIPNGAPAAQTVPTPTVDQLDRADPHSPDATARGAALFMAQACLGCHGAEGSAPGDLALGPNVEALHSRADFVDLLRKPNAAMPLYYPAKLTDPEVDDLLAFLQSLPPTNPRPRPGPAPAG